MQEEKQIWERQEGETEAAFRAFCIYRDMGIGKRAMRLVPRTTEEKNDDQVTNRKQPDRIVAKWSTAHNWRKRCEAYDNYLEKKARMLREEQLERIGDKALNVIEQALDFNIADLFEIRGGKIRMKDLDKLPEHIQKAIKKIKIGKGGAEIENLDKLTAAKEAARLAGLYEKDNHQRLPSDLKFNIVVKGNEEEV